MVTGPPQRGILHRAPVWKDLGSHIPSPCPIHTHTSICPSLNISSGVRSLVPHLGAQDGSQSWKHLPARMRVLIFLLLFEVGGPLSSLPPGPCPIHPSPHTAIVNPALPTIPGLWVRSSPPAPVASCHPAPRPHPTASPAVPSSHTHRDQQLPLPGVGLLLMLLTGFTGILTPKTSGSGLS